MPVNIKYKEVAGSFQTLVIIYNPDDPNSAQEFPIFTPIFNLIKPQIDDGTLDLGKLFVRTSDVSKSLP